MKSEATTPQTARPAYNSSIKASGAVQKSPPIKMPAKASGLKNGVANDRKERGRSPTVRALIWSNAMTQIKLSEPKGRLVVRKMDAQIQHIEYASPSAENYGAQPNRH